MFVGQVFVHLPSVGSTNAYALDLLSKSKPAEGTVISAFEQTAGRGQIGSGWESEPGKNISLSIVFYPTFLPARHQFQLNQAISLAAHDLVAAFFGETAKIKWPNDLYVGSKKIAGILIQNSVSGSHLNATVVGIGLNVNQAVFNSNPPNPTSFLLETGSAYDLETLIVQLMQFVESRYLQLKSGKIANMHEDYLAALYRFGTAAKFRRAGGEIFTGTIAGITESGRLRVLVQEEEATFDLKEISFVL